MEQIYISKSEDVIKPVIKKLENTAYKGDVPINEFRFRLEELKGKIEAEISKKIIETNFYKDYERIILNYYCYNIGEILVFIGGYGIGKSRTIKQILDSYNIKYYITSGSILYELKHVKNEFYKLSSLDKDTLIVFDDAKLTKWVDHFLLNLANENRPIVIIVNDPKEISKLEKTKGRLKIYTLRLSREDIELLKRYISEKFNINLDKYIIINIRDLVNSALSELMGAKFETLVEEIVNNGIKERKRKEEFRNFINKLENTLKQYNLELTEDIIIEVGVKIFGYSESTLRKNLSRYIY